MFQPNYHQVPNMPGGISDRQVRAEADLRRADQAAGQNTSLENGKSGHQGIFSVLEWGCSYSTLAEHLFWG